ncbi:predicted protein [Sclerotinia sclerotiorum 1980 UF-70]|uniref:Uncharacterized protein n=2 Tax=Sclerotinia sclerotiorum (strain ATCC 18683 / 1980 / Ss-1) TaxID=665079 RepID=A0A1D9PY19_SCLS1|nr:predicted protein [Sclerotinia sclerotiorum 1980 UF-70]APA07452.1 hypothetical protein sscle_03g022220 [Sclerotinia sclerotiorum 1980 UF-70]EDN91671.1 predicted protein [Sclerotinia sclerotiorum 1980 UF-70]
MSTSDGDRQRLHRANRVGEIRPKLYAEKLRFAEQYEIDAGYIYAAPEECRRMDTYEGILDWALIRNDCTDPENALTAVRFHPKIIGRSVNELRNNGDTMHEKKEKLNRKYEALNRANILHIKHPQTFSSPDDEALYFKPPSRTSDWKACLMNSIKDIIHNEGYGTSHEHVFVGQGLDGVSENGDSGALIYDIDIIPCPGNTFNTAALLPMAMIWGGASSGEIVTGFRDVTYAMLRSNS